MSDGPYLDMRLAEWQAAGRTLSRLDMRRESVRFTDAREISGSQWPNPEAVFSWKDRIPRDRPAILYCAKGHEISQGIAATLAAMGLDARYVIDGFSGWLSAGQPIRSLTDQAGGAA